MQSGTTLLRSAIFGLAFILPPIVSYAEDTCAPTQPPAVPRADRAVSLKRLEAKLRACQPQMRCAKEDLTWYGITHISGYVVNAADHDIVMFGAVEPGLPPLRIEDFAVALRSAAHQYVWKQNGQLVTSDPAVSIDPDPAVMRRLDEIMAPGLDMRNREALEQRLDAWCRTCELPQGVRVLGLPFDSHFSQTMVTADYLMKRIVDGSVHLAAFESLADGRLRQRKEEALANRPSAADWSSLTRFWFHAGQHRYLEDDRTVLLTRSDVILLNEAETVTPDGHIVSSGKKDPAARAFTCAFSRHFPELASANSPYPIYAQLAGLYRWTALARILMRRSEFETAGYAPDYLLDGFTIPEVKVARTLPGIAEVKAWDNVLSDGRTERRIMLRLPSCGGVTMAFDRNSLVSVRDTGGDLARVSRAVTATRLTPVAISWLVRQ